MLEKFDHIIQTTLIDHQPVRYAAQPALLAAQPLPHGHAITCQTLYSN